MASINDVPAQVIIQKVAEQFKQMPEMKAPEWTKWVKTGAHAERKPDNPDWWYVRCASILRKIYIQGPIGVQKLRKWYGGKKNRGVKPEKHVDASGKIIRTALQSLEKAGLVEKHKKGGRIITSKGQSLLDKIAAESIPRKEKKQKKPEKKTKKSKKSAKKSEKKEEKDE
ncbi:MAG: 30S ribosomal protein S19e [Candidatus Diapherotrites archaeon]|nr:30S ribosomal protein S19e [Candidatus Diapherotrites archaeon]